MTTQWKFNSHSLVEIPSCDWRILLNLYSGTRSEPTGYNVVLNYIQWTEKESDLDVKFLSLDGEWQSDGTFIIIVISHMLSIYSILTFKSMCFFFLG